jgi:hypothetical protein
VNEVQKSSDSECWPKAFSNFIRFLPILIWYHRTSAIGRIIVSPLWPKEFIYIYIYIYTFYYSNFLIFRFQNCVQFSLKLL